MKVRPAVHQDIPKIAEIHVKSWQTTYQGIISQEYLDGLTIEEREESWRRRPLEGTFVAEDEDGVFGFASFGKQRDERYSTYDGELYAIYLLQQKQKSGAGIALIAKGVEYLIEKGYQKLMLWVFEQNSAKQFYQKLQPSFVVTSQFELAGENHNEIGYGWELSRLNNHVKRIKSSASSNNERKK
ncbi:GNAT family N-acetyltransferase [Bacillus safensis]|uniref:GNAT family N-acetyltransferase n=1 Tax=Bacillus safensis TaxID=561879 RepID=UPI0022811DE5|nr:GNAT family N-acetyltransferase [Bacillus safensis]MCY7733658.1 GNAT family N-acetyltransferase [Bacillus safensis]MEC1113472.1 GNAT family N-acetyltransferase [Bacillus safensis]